MRKRWLILSCVVLLAACNWVKPNPTLYQRLGGQAAIVAVVDDFVSRVSTDCNINTFFDGVDIVQLKTHLVEQICAGTGGPCEYTGRDMKTVHDEFSIEAKHFDATVDHLIVTLHRFQVGQAEQNELLAILGSMKPDIVNTATEKTPIVAKQLISTPTITAKTPPKTVRNAVANKPATQKQRPKKRGVKTLGVKKQKEKNNVVSNIVNKAPSSALVAKQSKAQGAIQGTIILLGKDKQPVAAGKIIVTVTPAERALISPRVSKTFEIAMQNKIYTPSHLVVQQGDTVTFKNMDRLKHNVFSSSPENRFDLGTYPRGKRPGFTFQNEGLVKVYCNLHKRMFTYIQVMYADRSAITQADGFFFMRDLPPGRYTLKAWHVSAEITRQFVVTPGNTVNMDLTLDGSLFIPKIRSKKIGAYPPKPIKTFDAKKYPAVKEEGRFDEEF